MRAARRVRVRRAAPRQRPRSGPWSADASGGGAAPTASSRTGGRIPGTPATGLARAGKAQTTTDAAHPRSVAPANGAVRPHGRGLARAAGAVHRVRRTAHDPRGWPRQPTGGPGTARHQLAVPGWPGEATPGGAGRRGWRQVCGSPAATPTGWWGWGASAAHARPPPRCAAAQSPRGGAPPPPRRGPSRRPVSCHPAPRRPGPGFVHDDLHALAPDVSGPLSPGAVRFLIPDQNVRRQRTTRSLTPRESAPCQAAPRRPWPWKPMPRRSA